MYYTTHYLSPLGDILLACDEGHIIGLWIGEQKYLTDTMPKAMKEMADMPLLQRGVKWLDDYFSGKKPGLSALPLAPAGGEFRQCVWKILTEIPYGQVTTYAAVAKETAKRMGKERMAAQAVGGAIGHNPISILIPCHRVIGTNGSLTGYAGGIEKKRKLLELEGADLSRIYCFSSL